MKPRDCHREKAPSHCSGSIGLNHYSCDKFSYLLYMQIIISQEASKLLSIREFVQHFSWQRLPYFWVFSSVRTFLSKKDSWTAAPKGRARADSWETWDGSTTGSQGHDSDSLSPLRVHVVLQLAG